MPLTMPVSTAHSTCGYCCAASPNGQCSATSVSDVAARLGVRGESVRGERVGDRRDRGLHRAVAFGRLHARRDRAAVLVADLFGERARLVDRQPLERAGEQRAEQVVAAGREREVRVVGRRAVALRRPARPTRGGRARRRGSRRPRASRGGGGRRWGGARTARRPRRPWHAVGMGADEEVDVAAGGVAEGAGDGGDRGRELVRSEVGRWSRGYSTYVRSGNPPEPPSMPTEAEVLDALRPVEDPEIHRSIVDLDMVRGIEIDGRPGQGHGRADGRRLPAAGRDHQAGHRRRRGARRRERRRRRPHGHDRRGAPRARAAAARRRSRARPTATTARAPRQPVHRLAHARARDRVGQGRRRQVVGHDEPRGRARAARARRSPRSTPTSGASRCRACSASTGRRPSSTTSSCRPKPTASRSSRWASSPARTSPSCGAGPMLHKALEQFLTDVHWGEPDYLVVDMPPGTGDIALSMAQFLPRAEVIIVTTPQPAAQKVAQRAAYMARKVNLSVVGVIENMSWFRVRPRQRVPRSSARAAARSSPTSSRCRCSARCRSCPSCARAPTTGDPIVVSDPDDEASMVVPVDRRALDVELAPQARLPHRAQDRLSGSRVAAHGSTIGVVYTPASSSSRSRTSADEVTRRRSRPRSRTASRCCGSPTRRAGGSACRPTRSRTSRSPADDGDRKVGFGRGSATRVIGPGARPARPAPASSSPGKGGVGKSTMAAATALLAAEHRQARAARRGRRQGRRPRAVRARARRLQARARCIPGVLAMAMDTEASLQEYLRSTSACRCSAGSVRSPACSTSSRPRRRA